MGNAVFVRGDIREFEKPVDLVVQNPPFGTKDKHADKKFLEKAFSLAPLVYSMHKYSTQRFVEAICNDYKFKITAVWRYEFPIKAALLISLKK